MTENSLHQSVEVTGGQPAGSNLDVQYQNMPKQPGSDAAQADTSQADTAGPRLFRSKVDVALAAEFAVAEQMDRGAQQGYCPDSWRTESIDRHIRRAIKHALTYLEIRDGDRDDDGEDHLSAAVCRLSMALARRNLTDDERSTS